jgi:subtilisin family serine protease
LESLTVAKGATVTLDLQWDQPFANIGTGHAAADSLGMVLYDAAGHIVAYAMNDQVGGNPDQILQYTNTSGAAGLRLAIVTNGGTVAPGQFKVIAYGSGITINDRYAGIGSGTTIGHEMVADANIVGAVNYANTPQFGGDGTVESFSSAGSAGLLFDASGNRISAAAGGGVSFLAPDGSATSVYSPFYGTSAAAPNAAAVAALLLQANPSLTPAGVTNILEQTAIAARGPAGAVGAGLIDAAAAVRMAGSSGAITAGAGMTGSDTATIAANLLATAVPANPVAASASVGAANFSASLADPASTLGLAQAAALATGQSFAMLAGWDPTTIGG